MKRRLILGALGLALAATGAAAQPELGRPVRIIIPLGVGTPSDSVTRIIAPSLSAILGQPVVVDNKPGANGVLAVQELMRAQPDGATLLMGSVSPLAINMTLVKNLPYDPRRDLTPIAGVYSGSHAWIVRSAFPARTMQEFVAYARQHPGKVSVGHSAALQQIQFTALNKMAGIDLLLVPYKATNTSFTDVIGGTLDLTLMDVGAALAQARGGQVRVLAVSTLRRNPLAPDWPAVSETVPGFDFSSWSALVGPPGMPRDVVNRISAAMVQVLKQKEVAGKLAEGGIVPWSATSDELKIHINAEVARWIKLAREANIQPE